LIHFYKRVCIDNVKIALAATTLTIIVAKMSSSSSEAESPDIKPKNPTNVRPPPPKPRQPEKEKKEDDPKPGPSEEPKEKPEGDEEEKEAEDSSRWRKLYNKTAFTFTSSRDSAAAAAAAKKAAAAEKLKATQESIIASKNAAAQAAWEKKEAAAKAAAEKKEAATAAAIARKEAAAAKLRETGDTIKSSTYNAYSATGTAATNSAASVNSGFWNVVDMAKKAAVDPKSIIPGRAAESISLVHYNDVANIDPRDTDPVGGAARFLTAVKSHKEEVNPLIIFSGNVFSPSMISTLTKGEQMVLVMNMIGTHCAVFGNHDFDYGLDVFTERREKSDFPWIISNVIDNESGQPLGGGKVYHTMDWEGRKLGIIGLVEREWLDTVATIDKEHIDYTDYVDAAAMLADELKRKGCEYIIAITHMRTDNDVRLAEKVPEIGLILGGHSLVYEKRKVNGVYILKSGSDFRQFSKININFKETPAAVEIECVEVNKEIVPDEELTNKLEEYKETEDSNKDEVLGKLGCDLDGRFSSVRTAESNLGNLMADVTMAALQADCALLNAGTIRSNAKHAKGEFKLRDLLSILPMIDALVLIDVKGEHIHQALENGVSQWPKLDAKFPQVAGITFAFDPTKPPGSRIDPAYIKIGSEYMDKHQHYKMATKASLANGEDGYTALNQGAVLIDDQCAPSLTAAMVNHFKSVKLKKQQDDEEDDTAISVHQQPLVTKSCYHQDRDIAKRQNTAAKLRPKADGRIVQSSAEVLAKLKEEKEAHKSGSSKKKSKHRSSSPSDKARDALFDSPNKKAVNGVNGASKSKSKKSVAAEDLK